MGDGTSASAGSPVDTGDVQSSHERLLQLVGPAMNVLDLGCGDGVLAARLRAQGCRVTGVEIDQAAAAAAEIRCDRVVVADLDTADLRELAQYGPYDVILAADVLEHLRHPERVLSALGPMLAPQGFLLASIPNVAHGSVRLALLAGHFPYGPNGLLDTSQVRFYTRASMSALMADAGFNVAYVEDQQRDPEHGDALVEVDMASLPEEARSAVREDRDSSVSKFIAVASPHDLDEGLLGPLSRLRERVHALEDDLCRNEKALASEQERHDTERAELLTELEQARSAILTAQSDTLEARRENVLNEVQLRNNAGRIHALQVQVEALAAHEAVRPALEAELDQMRDELATIKGSKLWRMGTAYRRTIGRVFHRRRR